MFSIETPLPKVENFSFSSWKNRNKFIKNHIFILKILNFYFKNSEFLFLIWNTMFEPIWFIFWVNSRIAAS